MYVHIHAVSLDREDDSTGKMSWVHTKDYTIAASRGINATSGKKERCLELNATYDHEHNPLGFSDRVTRRKVVLDLFPEDLQRLLAAAVELGFITLPARDDVISAHASLTAALRKLGPPMQQRSQAQPSQTKDVRLHRIALDELAIVRPKTPNPSMHRTRYSGVSPLPLAGALWR